MPMMAQNQGTCNQKASKQSFPMLFVRQSAIKIFHFQLFHSIQFMQFNRLIVSDLLHKESEFQIQAPKIIPFFMVISLGGGERKAKKQGSCGFKSKEFQLLTDLCISDPELVAVGGVRPHPLATLMSP